MPLFSGAAIGLRAGGRAESLVPLAVAVLALFWLRTPAESWVGSTPVKARSSEEIRLVRFACLILTSVSAAALLWLFRGGRNRELLWIGALAAAAFLGQTAIRRTWRKARGAAQMVGALGLTSVAAAAYYVVTDRLDWAAYSLWGLNFLFAANQIQFVQLRIRAAHTKSAAEKIASGRAFLLAQTLTLALLAAGCFAHRITWYVALAFLPVLWRGFAWYLAPFRPLAVHTLGKQELAHAIVFGVLLIALAAAA